VHTGIAGARECRAFPCIPTSWANPSHVVSGPLPKGDGASEFGLVVAQGIIVTPQGCAGLAMRGDALPGGVGLPRPRSVPDEGARLALRLTPGQGDDRPPVFKHDRNRYKNIFDF